ncbi:hypothetical protein BU24DRAFT_349594 [Aaosphaeria arxii CBS 175.79]|uniref:Zn(2)-C6 fungal-type domain-containing protein n=1 Tax=Aaosphaeria arxii CBS 175.79 TaxID=1450172 RepID=A0A6A5XKD4_9PLEO|nr:uncharacterized protein BU24DRAFT_349594 [Aaosphaeria arxii CBS 175.79]KAF2013336.1 hypothetical protein BU24DRAFT_349594 [Aaosphaeria arxii CBS 175.79]
MPRPPNRDSPSSHTSVDQSSITITPQDSPGNRAVMDNQRLYRKRHRILTSCTECHRRKQKCNRVQPCQHCTKRSKPELCRYENVDSKYGQYAAINASTNASGDSGIESSTISAPSPSMLETNSLSPQDNQDLVNVLGYSTHSEHNTLGLVQRVETTSPSTSSRLSTLNSKQQTALDHKYRSLVRQLPSKEHIDILVQHFFSDINWHYDVIDEITFRQQLENWRSIPYSAHSNAISVLPADVLAFPSLLFQLMAHALLHQPVADGTCSRLESLKYASEMTFVDLACDFSEAGFSTLETIGKNEVTVVAVQSGILRASLLKNTGNVIEAWHVLGTAIRDAQEIGLHAESTSQTPSASIDAQWDKEMRRKIWFVLHNWDIHMAVVLGRPITTMMATGNALDLPDDLAQRESGTLPRKRTSHDPPTPSSIIHIGYDVAYRYFPQVHGLENRGARIEDYNIVRETHAAIVKNMDRVPLWCRHEDPDTQFDEFPSCHWLPAARQALTSGIYFVLLSLHRPYIFSVAESRTVALKAALNILTVQRRLFHLSEPQQYISFNMVYPMFDAMVISLATVVLFPNENLDIVSELVQNVRWGIDVLNKIGEHNAMARSAYSIVKKLFSRLKQSGPHAIQHSSHTSESVTEWSSTETADLGWASTSLDGAPTVSNVDAELPSPTYQGTDLGALNPHGFHFETLLPPQPVHDLFYQDIYAPDIQEACPGPEFPLQSLDFDGHYPDNSFWSFMSNFTQPLEST